MRRLLNAIKLFWMALLKPKVFQIQWFMIVEWMMKFLESTAKSEHPMACKLACDMPEITKLATINWKKKETIVMLHLWCGVDNSDSPFKRIAELVEENQKLKSELRNLTPKL